MKFIDEAIIYVESGKGGSGCVSFRREKFIPRGGPDGGDGGKGGDVIIAGKKDLASLHDFRYKRNYKAENGKAGAGKNRTGREGRDVTINVPLGTVVYDRDTSELLFQVLREGETHVAVHGGRGGRGNARFVTSTHRAPMEYDAGEEGQRRWLHLDLKLLADVGLVGHPNAGKSTLISRLTQARPKVGDYPFTTLTPALGVLDDNEKTFVIADIPGIIEGASRGKGLGLAFLKHIERTNALLVVLDLSSGDVRGDYRTLLEELGSYSEAMLGKRRLVVLNKADLVTPDVAARWRSYLKRKGEKAVVVSALTLAGMDELVSAISEGVEALRQNLNRAV
ncbi:MAG: GTPase Obg [Syntrophorhabdus sp. PtaB.Bin047]|jgi:GTP-binding protein|nr:MAG: GTPase Obg [Syntrophorhabdus sp. PtaB.Bin047]